MCSTGQLPRKVHLDGCVEVESAYYSAPPRLIGQAVHVQWTTLVVRLIDPATGALLREHARQSPGSRRMQPEDRPPRTPEGVLHLLGRARRAGRAIGRVCDQIHRSDGQLAVRRIQGILAMVKKHGISRVEASCEAALAQGLPTYRFVRRDIARSDHLLPTLRHVDPLIRELTEYRAIIETMAAHTDTTEGDPS